jgi:LacI family transcriptional regulator
VTNDRQGAIEVANYLAAQGHTRIALVTGPQRYLSARERGGGFIDALRAHGIALAPECIVESGYTFESGVEAGEQLLALAQRPTAVFALNDEMAAGIYAAAHRRGLAIPGELSVVGFDDSPLATRLWPSLSSVRLPIRQMGLNAASMLLAAEDDPIEGPQFAPHLVVRESAAAPR